MRQITTDHLKMKHDYHRSFQVPDLRQVICGHLSHRQMICGYLSHLPIDLDYN